MAALWLHTASLLVLLVISCPGSQAIASQYMCGSHLVDALNLVCGDRGFYYLPLSRVNPAPGGAASDQVMVKRSPVEQCCHRPCSLFDLENYCN